MSSTQALDRAYRALTMARSANRRRVQGAEGVDRDHLDALLSDVREWTQAARSAIPEEDLAARLVAEIRPDDITGGTP